MRELALGGRKIKTALPAFVMGIVNVTPDSFYEKSRGGSEHARKLIDEGACILDLGGESSRPGSAYVSAEEEMGRLLPVIKEIRKISDIPISVDTRKYEVMKACCDCGADILNDISALEDDEKLARFCAETKIPVILMHKRGNPDSMQKNTEYKDVFGEVNSYLMSRVEYALGQGIAREKIWLDAGIGFGKNLAGNMELMRRCSEIGGGEFPLVMALSRKTCIGELTGRAVEDRLAGTLAANLLCVEKGAAVIRVHDVKESVDSLKVLAAFCGTSDRNLL